MGQPEGVLADEHTVPYTVLWHDILHYCHLSDCGNARLVTAMSQTIKDCGK